MKSVERILINKKTGVVGIGIRVCFFDKIHQETFGKYDEFSILLSIGDIDGWLIYTPQSDEAAISSKEGNGPWVLFRNDVVDENCEVLE